jgi:hypothetical protein
MRIRLGELRKLVLEAAVQASGLPSDVGLIFESNKWSMQMVLVKLDVVDQIAKSGDFKNVSKAIIGGITATKEDVWRVGSVSAEHGYGPLLYRLAMQFATAQGSSLSSHQSGITSDEATAVWERFVHEPDVRMLKHPDKMGTRSRSFQHEGNDYERLAKRYNDYHRDFEGDIERLEQFKFHAFNAIRV